VAVHLARGRIKLWVRGKSYGFVEPDDGTRDVFFHVGVFEGGDPAEGEPVEYELATGTRIPQAQRVRRVVTG
jgi:cold shock CspA family protein